MLRKKYVERVKNLLKGEEFEWTVIIMDQVGQDVLAPLFTISELMEIGVVQCLRIEEPRAQIEEARAIYFVEETEENVKAFSEDVCAGTYKTMEILFTGIVPRHLFEKMAVQIGAQGESRRVKKVLDGLIRISVLDSSMYTLNIKDSFMKQGIFHAIEMGLLSLMQEIEDPIIYADKRYLPIVDAIVEKVKSLGIPSKRSKKKAAILLVGREIDLITPVEHGWTYSALITDILTYDLNKVSIPESMVRMEKVAGVDEETGEKHFDLNRSDTFWEKNKNEYFPTVAERIENELGEYKAELAQRSINSSSSKETISNALSKVPELSRKNKVIHTHMTLALSLVDEIKKHKIDEMVAIENDASKMQEIKDELNDLLTKVTNNHFLRMVAVLMKKFPEERVFFEGLIKKKGCNVEVLRFLVQGATEEQEEGKSLVSTAASSLFRNIKRILPNRKKRPITGLVEEILSGRSTLPFRELFPSQAPISSIHVFTVGGGTFNEYTGLMDLSQEQGVEISYGSTEILSPEGFLKQAERTLQRAQ
ncbi:sec1 family domain-containing protein 1 [Nematocida sp. LUAm3]|nr:sec1 family domain-containing protein 1 [Nematocida sp. LUAm3]KAI5175640.1 sec1 family domain-containing protein 1 [Nematocida sp. LUAm2]KAI5178546.1 sec1 family domain-containing protein 1 [Nematocida sp. LUAm1]